MAMEEKQLEFKRTIVNITEQEQSQAWYLRINPAGQVPLLQMGDSFISESDIIVETLDKLKNGDNSFLTIKTKSLSLKICRL